MTALYTGEIDPAETQRMTLRDDVTERAQARVGHTLNGKWHLDCVLGIGGMATVYAATHRNRSRAALKLLHPEVSISQDVTTRFLREGYVGNAVLHPGTVKVLDDDVTEDGAPFLVMELLEGESLGARLDRDGPLSPVDVAQIAYQLLDVLAAAHAAHIVHRDLKPDNVFWTSDGRVKVLDFGVARLQGTTAQTSAATQAGSLLGTPAFMAPEQALGRWKEVDERTDIWAVGATLFTLLTGRFVHEAEAVQEQLVLAATTKAKAVRTLAPSTPVWLAEIIDRALSFGRDQRFSDALRMQSALRQSAVGVELVPYPMTASRSASLFPSRAITPSGPHAPASSQKPQSSPSYTDGATLAATNVTTLPGPGAFASVQAVARSAQEPPPSRRSPVASLALGALGFSAVIALATGFWLRQTKTTEVALPSAATTALAIPISVSAPPPPVPPAQPALATAAMASSAPAASTAPARAAGNVPTSKPVTLAKKGGPAPPPPAFTLPTFSPPSKQNGNNAPEQRENLFDQRH